MPDGTEILRNHGGGRLWKLIECSKRAHRTDTGEHDFTRVETWMEFRYADTAIRAKLMDIDSNPAPGNYMVLSDSEIIFFEFHPEEFVQANK